MHRREPGSVGPCIWIVDRTLMLERPYRCSGAYGLWMPPAELPVPDEVRHTCHVYTCMYRRMYICVYRRMYICMHCMYRRMYICVYRHKHICMYRRMCIRSVRLRAHMNRT